MSRLSQSFLRSLSACFASPESLALMLQSKRLPRTGNFLSYVTELSPFYVKGVLEFANVEMMGAFLFD